MKWLGFVIVGVAILVLIVVGAALPQRHVATLRARIQTPREQVWGAITDVAAFPGWRAGVDSVELLPASAGPGRWIERGRDGDITYERVEASPPDRLVVRIADEHLPFGGTWTYDLADGGAATLVTITEDGIVRNPVFRFMSRFIFGHHATLDAYLRSLGRHFGQDVDPERVP
ncbi:MAG TPA: SRPBCC family protein [Longimicrobiales bacterium]|nr:SRPBCC family protein [Longimicrobiales bacterium]